MKVSNFVIDIQIDNVKKMLYSTLTRQYYVYDIDNEEKIKYFLQNINKGIYTENEISLFHALFQKKIIIQDNVDELKILEVLENSVRYQEHVYKIMIYATNACNFRCEYCIQPHVEKSLEEDTIKRILKLIHNRAKQYKKIEIEWFGGEPLMEYEKICKILENVHRICREQNCELVVSATTNGYLLTAERIEKLKELQLKRLQITLDGNSKTHNKRRVLLNGEGTYEIVWHNVIEVLKAGIKVILRINVDEENVHDISEILDGIPLALRSNVFLNVCNIFQTKKKVSTFSLIKESIAKGYGYANRTNTYIGCHADMKNALIIDTDGSVLFCSNAPSIEKRLGYLDDNGVVKLERLADYYSLQTLSARKNPECQKCIELPLCISSCKYTRFQENLKCKGRRSDGLSIEERALLDYYADLYKKNIG